MRRLISLILALFCSVGQVLAQTTNAADSQVEINAQVSFGLGYGTNTSLLNYIEPGTTTCRFANSTTIFVPPSTYDQQINLSSLFPYINEAVLWGIKDISSPGQQVNWGLAEGGQRFYQKAGGFTQIRVSGSAPTIYVDNPSMTTAAILQVFVLAN